MRIVTNMYRFDKCFWWQIERAVGDLKKAAKGAIKILRLGNKDDYIADTAPTIKLGLSGICIAMRAKSPVWISHHHIIIYAVTAHVFYNYNLIFCKSKCTRSTNEHPLVKKDQAMWSSRMPIVLDLLSHLLKLLHCIWDLIKQFHAATGSLLKPINRRSTVNVLQRLQIFVLKNLRRTKVCTAGGHECSSIFCFHWDESPAQGAKKRAYLLWA